MPDLPEEALHAAAEAARADAVERFREPVKPVEEFVPDVLHIVEAVAPAFAVREEEIRADERRKVTEQIAAALLAVDSVEWALAGQHAGKDAADIARKIGEGRDSR